MRERMLSFHARYRCQDSGDCCSAGWAIAIEPDRLGAAEHALQEGRLRMASAAPAAFVRSPGAPTVLATHAGACVFYRNAGSHRCEIHRGLGHAALPLACRRFPRISVVDPGGVSTSLSHFCPTVRALLGVEEPAEVVSREFEVERDDTDPADLGLDVRDSVPPLLRPGMFMDWKAWWLFERLAIELLQTSSAHGLPRLGTAIEALRQWSTTDGPLRFHVEWAFRMTSNGLPRLPDRSLSPHEHLEMVLDAIPEPLRPARTALVGDRLSALAARRLLLSHAFANWTAHLGHGLRTWLRSLEAVEALLSFGLGAREVDLLIRHLADPSALALAWSAAERD